MWHSRKYFPESWKICRFSASRAFARVRKKRHPEMPFARSRPGIRPSGGFVASLCVDHQMTPPLFAGAFRAFGPCAPLTSARLSGTPAAALRPKASRRAGIGNELFSFEKSAAYPSGSLGRWPSFRPFRYAHSGFELLFLCLMGILTRHCPALHGFRFTQSSVGSKHFPRKQNSLQAVGS